PPPPPLHKPELELPLRYGESPEELRAAIASAIDESDHLWRLAEDLLLMARADKGRLTIDREPVEVSALFATVSDRMAGPAQAAGRSLVAEHADGMVVEADRPRIEQALDNLVDNALLHGDGTIRLSARTGGGGNELHVSDSGAGIPPDFRPHALDRVRPAALPRAGG